MTIERRTPIEIEKEEFKKIGYGLIDRIADFIDTMDERPVTKGEAPKVLQQALGMSGLPEHGSSPESLLTRATDLLFEHSLFNGHPKFSGYITSSPAPIGILSDLLASAMNPNVGAQILSPMATEIEKQTVQWLAELVGLPSGYGGILVSGGNMANFTAFLAARTAKAPRSLKDDGIDSMPAKMLIYCPKSTHTWVEKAVILFGHGYKSIRWIKTNATNQMDISCLEEVIRADIKDGYQPMMVIGTAGDVSTGAVDNLSAIATICETYDAWFHIDGAYGAPAAVVPAFKSVFKGMERADSIALDPHKWLYSPMEAGCTLVKNPQHLTNTYSSHPEYYNFTNDDNDPAFNYYEYGLQNSRGFRALKVWMALQHIGRKGYEQMIGEDIALSKLLFNKAQQHIELEAVTQSLSITTLRYVPQEVANLPLEEKEAYLNTLNETLLNTLQRGGEMFPSNAVVHGKYCLRVCIVNFKTSEKDIAEVVEIIVKEGAKVHQILQKKLYTEES